VSPSHATGAPTTLTVQGDAHLHGAVRTPGEKSISHRSLLLSALADGRSTISGLSDGDDVARTRTAVETLGAATTERDDGVLEVVGGRGRLHAPSGPLDCGNSGTGLRLLAGLVAGFDWSTELAGDASLSLRPMDRIAEPLTLMGATVQGQGDRLLPPLLITGGALHGIEWTSKVASAQVKSAILLAGLSAEGATVVNESIVTRMHTEEMLEQAGADITVTPWQDGHSVRVQPSTIRPTDWTVPGDPSQSAFWVVAGCIVAQSELTVEAVYDGPARGGFLTVLKRMGAQITTVRRAPGRVDLQALRSDLSSTVVEASEIPSLDEIPILAVAAAAASGTTVFRDVAELRVKEVDRQAATVSLVQAFGAEAEAVGDELRIHGVGPDGRLQPGHFDSQGDHRMAMAAAVAAMAAGPGTSVLTSFDAVATSYPRFVADLSKLGAVAT
jgi:3-phosphoshikimate 1-carboxyvinyltransferase